MERSCSSTKRRMTVYNSPISSGLSAEVGSSNSKIFGRMVSARANSTRCCWSPESWFAEFVGRIGKPNAFGAISLPTPWPGRWTGQAADFDATLNEEVASPPVAQPRSASMPFLPAN